MKGLLEKAAQMRAAEGHCGSLRRFGWMDFCSLALGLGGIILSAGTDVFEQHHIVNGWVFWIGVTSLAILIFNQIWPRPLEALASRLRMPGVWSDAFVSLPEAARRLIEADPDSVMANMARRESAPGEQIGWWCNWFATTQLPIYGQRPPSRIYERIPQRSWRTHTFLRTDARSKTGSIATFSIATWP